MEQLFGKLWNHLIIHGSSRRFPKARVHLDDVETTLGILFRALGGDGHLRLEAVPDCRHRSHRHWLERLAGNGTKTPWCWVDEQALHLPATLDIFPELLLNRDLFIWLAALTAQPQADNDPEDWFVRNQLHTHRLLADFPGLRSRYRRLVQAHLLQRPDPARLPSNQAALEMAVRAALLDPEQHQSVPKTTDPLWPVPLWPHPNPPLPRSTTKKSNDPQSAQHSGMTSYWKDKERRQARYVQPPRKEGGLLLHRFESIFSWADFVRVDRATDEEDDTQSAAAVAEDLDVLSIAQDPSCGANRLRFDLDLPSQAEDDISLGSGILLPEWNFRQQALIPNHCCLQPMMARHAGRCELPEPLRQPARRLRGQFETLRFGSAWLRRQKEGSEVDLDAFLHHQCDRLHGRGEAEDRLYRDLRLQNRDLACLLLADLSLSTDTWINDEMRVIDVIRDAMFLFAEALSATQDRFALYGFSSRRREHVRFYEIKSFDTPYDTHIRGRIQAVRPGFYTRMGTAIRQSTALLSSQPTAKRLLLLLTDGKPNDIDTYEGRYGIEDTRMALLNAKKWGIQPFCVTIDREAGAYSTHLFGPGQFVLIRKASDLPRQLPRLYYQLTR
ncbi:MAG: nitric oxide reductase [Magnetococcales bacterium]|nr:nitric oxide reductase [Magnetococcales bacterium]